MNTLTVNHEQSKCNNFETACPYNGIKVCTASFSSMAIDSHKRDNCCGTDNYDDCPIFLSKVLRRR
jgi:hypothetical protein